MIRLNEKINTTLTIETEGLSKKLDINDKYFIPSKEPFKDIININTTGEALIEILYSFGDDETNIINGSVTDEIVKKNVTLIEYNPNGEKKNIIISFESKDKFSFSTYGGPSKDNYFYHSKNNYPLEMIELTNYAIRLEDPLADYDLEDGEKYYISLLFKKTNPSQEIKITVKYISNPIEEFNEVIEETYANQVISNLASIVNNYIFRDIAQIPPEPNGETGYAHPPINIIEALNNVDKKNRKFYEFYRDIKEIIGKPRDLHFRISGLTTPKGYKFNYVTACLPFSFYVEKDQEKKAKMYIKYYKNCAVYYSEKIKNDVHKFEEKYALEYINGMNPFEYVQNWDKKYRTLKTPHAQFSYTKRVIHAFALTDYPLNQEELKIKLKFENVEDILDIDYHIQVPNIKSINNLLGTNIFNEEEFDEFYENERKKIFENQPEPNIFDTMKKYKKYKGIIFEEEKKELKAIQWDYETPDKDGIKCRVDEKNNLNVLVQESFYKNYETSQSIIEKCAKKFHENNNRVVIIENNNGGGYVDLAVILRQLIQAKILNKGFASFKSVDILKSFYEENANDFVDAETCRYFDSFDTFKDGPTDKYTNGSITIEHKRGKIADLTSRDIRKRLNDLISEYPKENIKKPTDIIVFTDSYSYSATSIFIKSLQNEGGAIIVGYNGNPFERDELFDASQSPSYVLNFSFTREYQNLKQLGIQVVGINKRIQYLENIN